MAMKLNYLKYRRKCFVFTIFAIFFAILIFAVIQSDLIDDDYGKDATFISTRISKINSDFFYFKNVYMKNVITYSFYNSIDAMLNRSAEDSAFYLSYKNDYEKMNTYLFECMMNGTIDSVNASLMNGKIANDFLYEYVNGFNRDYNANLTFDILKINVYETQPYYLGLQYVVVFNLDMSDNLSSWESFETFTVSVPIYDLDNPDFLFHTGIKVPIRSAERQFAGHEWTFENFNETISNTYSALYMNKDYKYYAGSSFLRKLLGKSKGAYSDVIGFWSFDHDFEYGAVYDTSQYNILGNVSGNSRLIYSFSEDFMNESQIIDATIYSNDGILNGGLFLNDSMNCLNGGCIYLNESDSIEINYDSAKFDILKDFTISFWINDVSGPLEDNYSYFFKSFNGFDYSFSVLRDNGKLLLRVYDNLDNSHEILTNLDFKKNVWHNVVLKGNINNFELYVDGLLIGVLDINDGMRVDNGKMFFSGFKGNVDEVAMYSVLLSRNQISDILFNRKVLLLEYKDSLFGSGLLCDGENVYAQINLTSTNKLEDNYTIEFWIKPYSNLSGQGLFRIDGSTADMNVFLENDSLYVARNSDKLVFAPYEINKWNYYVISVDSGNLRLYKNSNHMDTYGSGLNIGSLNSLEIAYKDSYRFSGLFDEIRIMNVSISSNDIKDNYYNFASFVKGCCNYINLINPNKYGYNTPIYKVNVSYSSDVFFKYISTGNDSDLVLYNLTNITSYDASKEYYNFLFDNCILHAYSVSDYQLSSDGVTPSGIEMWLYKIVGIDGNSCENMIKLGIY